MVLLFILKRGESHIDIKGLNLVQVSNSLEEYIAEYFKYCKLSKSNRGKFEESYTLYFEEIKHLIPEEYHKLFKNGDKFNGASGYLKFKLKSKEIMNNDYIIMLLSDEDNTKAYILCLQEINSTTNEERIIILKNFLCT